MFDQVLMLLAEKLGAWLSGLKGLRLKIGLHWTFAIVVTFLFCIGMRAQSKFQLWMVQHRCSIGTKTPSNKNRTFTCEYKNGRSSSLHVPPVQYTLPSVKRVIASNCCHDTTLNKIYKGYHYSNASAKIWVLFSSDKNNILLKSAAMPGRRYEFYFRVVKTIVYERAQRVNKHIVF